MPTSHKITLPQLAVACLRDNLEIPGWATLISDQGIACKLLDTVIPEVPQPEEIKKARTQTSAREANTTWCNEPKEFEITDRQRDTVRKALKFHLERGSLPPGRYTFAVLKAFGLSSEE